MTWDTYDYHTECHKDKTRYSHEDNFPKRMDVVDYDIGNFVCILLCYSLRSLPEMAMFCDKISHLNTNYEFVKVHEIINYLAVLLHK
eukprot:m.60232 g.60232  ORF g.60232 m.60232 type:complete len:87 (+) comp11305_c2_seq1:1448-1708(+)